MPGYLDTLQGAETTFGAAFTDAYTKADRLAAELYGLRREGQSRTPGSRAVPGTVLEVGKTCAPARGGKKGVRSTVTVAARLADQSAGAEAKRLFSVTHRVVPPQGAPLPEAVAAFRQAEHPADYTLEMTETGLVTCRLGELGLRGSKGAREAGPAGQTNADQAVPVAQMAEAGARGMQRLEVVGAAIVRAVDMAETMALGATFEEALDEVSPNPAAAAAVALQTAN